MRSILLPTQKQSTCITIDKKNFQVHTDHYVTYMRVIFASIVFSNNNLYNPCDIFKSDVTYNFQVI